METQEICPHLIEQNITRSLQKKLIYKDQCTKCFVEAKDEKGINLCLKCFNGGCISKYNHSQDHFEKFTHPIVLNVKLTEENESKEQQVQEITKLAIGIKGGAQSENKKFIAKYTLYCLICQKAIDSTKVSELIKSIEQADSAFKCADIGAWELEIFPCEHTLTLQQCEPYKIEDNLLAHCKNCQLSANLWLCLTCGNLGCGRKNWDGTGGNNHGIEHYNTTKHPLVVKLGTITPDGNASLYCYACNQDVSDENLAFHLYNFGIEVGKCSKTEKTIAELCLEANLTLTLSSIIEEGKILTPLFGPGLTGLENIGNSCYINSVVQTLFSLKEFQQRYYKEGLNHLAQCKKFPPDCYYCQMSKLGNGLCSGDFSIKLETQPLKNQILSEDQKYYQPGIKLNDFKNMVAKDHAEFKTNKMQDALEYLEHILSFINKNERICQMSDITEIFQFQGINKLECTICQGVKLVKEKTTELKLPVRRPTTQELELAKLELEEKKKQREAQKLLEENLSIENQNQKEQSKIQELSVKLEDPEYNTTFEECLELFMQGSGVELFCTHCQKQSLFLTRYYLASLPKYLIVPVQRFVEQNWVPYKLNAIIKVPEVFDFSALVYKPKNEKLLPEQNVQIKKEEFVPNQDALNELFIMGFSQNRAIRALKACNNNLEVATNWIFERMDDASLDLPLEDANKKAKTVKYTQENVDQLINYGFTEKASKIALNNTDNDIERAIEYILSHQDIENEPEEQKLQNSNLSQSEKIKEEIQIDNAKYFLKAAVIHLGRSTHAGHYVAYIKQQEQWILFNDAKVAQTSEPALGKAYFYLFEKS